MITYLWSNLSDIYTIFVMISLSWIAMKSDLVVSANKQMFILTLKNEFSSIHKNENHSYPTHFLLLNVL